MHFFILPVTSGYIVEGTLGLNVPTKKVRSRGLNRIDVVLPVGYEIIFIFSFSLQGILASGAQASAIRPACEVVSGLQKGLSWSV